MNIKAIEHSLCWVCKCKSYNGVFLPNGRYDRNYECIYPMNRTKFGQVQFQENCKDYTYESPININQES